MDHEADFDRLTEKLDPYHEFLRYGYLSAVVEDPDEWRAEIRRQARRDKIRMHSITVSQLPNGLYHVWAGKAEEVKSEALRDSMLLMDAQREAAGRASLRGHQPIVWLRVARGEEAAGRCRRCAGRVYVSRRRDPPIIDGDVYEYDCP